MNSHVFTVAHTREVKARKECLGSRLGCALSHERRRRNHQVTGELANLIAERDALFVAILNSECQPYIEHDGHSHALISVIDERTIRFTANNGKCELLTQALRADRNIFLFLMDFANRRHTKIWSRVRAGGDMTTLRNQRDKLRSESKHNASFLVRVRAWQVNPPKPLGYDKFPEVQYRTELRDYSGIPSTLVAVNSASPRSIGDVPECYIRAGGSHETI